MYTSDRLARVDTRTNEIKEYPLPTPYGSPYATAVDKTGIVWINTMNHDVLTKFDPKTERFTEYPLPTRGTEIRQVQVDNRTDPVDGLGAVQPDEQDRPPPVPNGRRPADPGGEVGRRHDLTGARRATDYGRSSLASRIRRGRPLARPEADL